MGNGVDFKPYFLAALSGGVGQSTDHHGEVEVLRDQVAQHRFHFSQVIKDDLHQRGVGDVSNNILSLMDKKVTLFHVAEVYRAVALADFQESAHFGGCSLFVDAVSGHANQGVVMAQVFPRPHTV